MQQAPRRMDGTTGWPAVGWQAAGTVRAVLLCEPILTRRHRGKPGHVSPRMRRHTQPVKSSADQAQGAHVCHVARVDAYTDLSPRRQSAHDNGDTADYACDGIRDPPYDQPYNPTLPASVTICMRRHARFTTSAAGRNRTTHIRHDSHARTCTTRTTASTVSKETQKPHPRSLQTDFNSNVASNYHPPPSPDRSQCPASQSVLNPTANMATCDSGTPSPDRSPCPT